MLKRNSIEHITLKSLTNLDVTGLNKLPNSNKIIYNNISYKEDLIAELKHDFSNLNYKGALPLYKKIGKCNFCYPNNTTYTFHNPITDELIFRCVVDKIDNENYFVMICENKPKSKLNSPDINKEYPF